MKKIIAGSLLVIGSTFFVGCANDGLVTLSDVVKKRNNIQKGMSKSEVEKLLKMEPDEISQLGDYTIWIYKGIIVNDDTEEQTFNDLVIKFINDKVAYIGYFKCKLPKEED